MSAEDGERFAAYHEAGHFVAHLRLVSDEVSAGITIVGDPEQGTDGHFSSELAESAFADESEADDPAELEDWIVVLYAGAEAELHLDPAREKEVLEGGQKDEEQATRLMSKLDQGSPSGAASRTDRAQLRQRARTLVSEHWEEIEAIATEVLEQKWLGGTVAVNILSLVNETNVDSAERALVQLLGHQEAAEVIARHKKQRLVPP